MLHYKAPLRDMRFLINEVLDYPTHYASLSNGAEATPEMVDAILEGAATLCEEVLAPLNASGDKEGCHLNDGVVTTPKGFKEAYAQLLLTKIEQWKEAMNSKEALYDSERKQQDSKCAIYLKMRADGLCRELLKKQIFPVVITQTHEQVLSFFKDVQHQKEYQDTLLKGFKRVKNNG